MTDITVLTIDKLPTASNLATTDIFPLLQGGVTKSATFSILPVIQSGAGATARSTQEKLREIQVTPQDYMTEAQKADVAARTLAIDVSAALLAAHDALPTTGGTITLPQGNYALAVETNFTKPVILQGAGRGATTLTITANTTNRDCIQTDDTIIARDLTIKTSTPPTLNSSMCGIRADITTKTGVQVIVERCEILDFCFPVFADGRGSGGQAFNIGRGVYRDCTFRVSSAAGVAADCFLSGCRQALVENCDIDNQDLGDHNIYLIRNFNNTVRNNRLLNTAATSSLCAIKMVTELSGDSGTLGIWAAENNDCESNALPILVGITGAIVLPKLRIVGNSIKTARSTTAGNGAAISIVASNTSTYRTIKIDDLEMSDVQLGGISLSCAAGATMTDIYIGDFKLFDFSKSSSGTYSAITTDTLGTYTNLIIGNLDIDGNSTGRNAINAASATYVNFVGDVKEANCTTTSSPVQNTKLGRSSTGIQNLTWNATATVADGGTVTHGLGTTPTAVLAIPTIGSEMVSVTAKGSTTFTVAIKKDTGAAGTTQTLYWVALV